jgi:hypothetical protein
MEKEAIRKAIDMAKLWHVIVGTADSDGLPHIAAAGKLSAAPNGRLAVEAWFCPGTVANLQRNRRISLVVWDPTVDLGYQILGEVEKLEECGILDGYAPGEDTRKPLPQVQRRLIVRVDSILDFRHARHSDVEDE